MLKFNWKSLKSSCKNDPTKIYSVFKYYDNTLNHGYVSLGRGSNSSIRKYLLSKREKNSFINNNERLVRNELNASVYEIYWYIYLASLRNPADFVFRKQLWLDIGLIPDNIKDKRMEANKLLTFDYSNNKIIFNYEE